ncbi:MAG: response regulator transcription factor [Calditrichia bacterium]
MSQVFVRSDQLQDIVFDIKLTMEEWKVLFAVDGQMNEQGLASFLDMNGSEVAATLEKLGGMQLLQTAGVVPQTAGDLDDSGEFEISLGEDKSIINLDDKSEEDASEEKLEFSLSEENGFDTLNEAQEDEADDAPESPGDDTSGDEDLDKLIGKLLDEEDDEEEDEEIEISLESDPEINISPPATDDPTVKFEDGDDFNLSSIFEEEIQDEAASMDQVLSDLDEPEIQIDAGADIIGVDTGSNEIGTGTILVVDDSVVIRKMVEIALENEEYKIVAVATGKEALKYLDENDPDLIILDIMLSDVNGLDILKAIKASKQIPVVMLSAKDTPRETTKAKQLGADDFIPKPFKDEELVSKIKELIKK